MSSKSTWSEKGRSEMIGEARFALIEGSRWLEQAHTQLRHLLERNGSLDLLDERKLRADDKRLAALLDLIETAKETTNGLAVLLHAEIEPYRV